MIQIQREAAPQSKELVICHSEEKFSDFAAKIRNHRGENRDAQEGVSTLNNKILKRNMNDMENVLAFFR